MARLIAPPNLPGHETAGSRPEYDDTISHLDLPAA